MELSDRFKRHQCDVKCDLFKYVKICNNGDWSKYNIELLQNAECRSRKELKMLQEAKINELKNSDDIIINQMIKYMKEEESIAKIKEEERIAMINELKNSDDTKINKIIEYIKEEESITTGLMMLRKKYLNIIIK